MSVDDVAVFILSLVIYGLIAVLFGVLTRIAYRRHLIKRDSAFRQLFFYMGVLATSLVLGALGMSLNNFLHIPGFLQPCTFIIITPLLVMSWRFLLPRWEKSSKALIEEGKRVASNSSKKVPGVSPKRIPNWLLFVSFPFIFFYGATAFVSPFWFWLQAKRLNKLPVDPKISIKMLTANVLSIPLAVTIGAIFSGVNSVSAFAVISFIVLSLVFFITYIIILFRVCDILGEYSEKERKDVTVSGVGAFFLGIFYLQYKINKLFRAPSSSLKDKA
jgi:MFS family permease